MANNNGRGKSLESWIWDAACSIRGAKDAPKYKDFILPLIFTKRLCDVFDDEVNRIATEVGSRKKAFQLVGADHKLVRFYLPLLPEDRNESVWSIIRKLSDKIGEGVTTHMRAIAKENPGLQGIIDRVDFNATTHGQRDIDDDRLSNLIEAISTKRLGLEDVEADIIGKSYEYPILRMTNQVDGQIVRRKLQYVEIGDNDFAKFKVERGEILFNRTNSLELVGRTAIFDIEGEFVFASYLIRLRTDGKRLNPFFLNCYFNTDEIQARLKSIATRAVSQSNISASRLKGFLVPKPSLDEQNEIVAHAKALDRKLAVHRSKLEQIQDLFRTLLHELMTAKLRVHQLEFQIPLSRR